MKKFNNKPNLIVPIIEIARIEKEITKDDFWLFKISPEKIMKILDLFWK